MRRSAWEPRPANYTANHTTPGSFRINRIDGADNQGQSRFAPRIDGDFTGTTDEIIQWGTCKWGFDEDIVRAVAVAETWWRQGTVGDNGESFGLIQVRNRYHVGTFPWSRDSTAFTVDYALAWRRSCYEGYFSGWVPSESRGDEWGCLNLWCYGSWAGQKANPDYRNYVKAMYDSKRWQQFHAGE